MADRELTVRLRARGDSEVRRVVRGVTSDVRKASTEQTRAAQQAGRAQQEIAKRTGAKVREEQARALAAHKATERERLRETERTERARIAAARRAVREAARDEERSRRRSTGRGRGAGVGDQVGDLVGRVGADLVSSGLRAVVDRFVAQLTEVSDAVSSAAGRQGIGERTATAQQFRLGLTRLGGEVFGGVPAEQRAEQLAQVEQEINRIALATNQEPGALLDALQLLQTEFSAFEFGRDNLRALGEEASRTGTDVQQLARFAGLVRQQFGELDTSRIFDVVAQGGLQGALSPEQLSGEFANQLGLFRSFADPNGRSDPEQLLRQFVASANVIRSSGASPAESATLMQNLASSLSDRRVQQRIAARTGVRMSRFRDREGRLDLAGYVEALAARPNFGSLESLRSTIGDQQASLALNALIMRQRDEATRGDDNATLRELQSVSAESGGAMRTANLRDVMGTSFMAEKGLAVQGLVAGIREETGQSGVAYHANAVRTALEDQAVGGVGGQLIAGTPGLSHLASFLGNAPGLGDLLRSDTVQGMALTGEGYLGPLAPILRAIGSTTPMGGPSGEPGTAGPVQVEAARPLQLDDARPVRVEVVNQQTPPAIQGPNGFMGFQPPSVTPTRTSSPRERFPTAR